MYSLVFLCAQKVVSHYTTLQDALGFLPKELYPVLFKAAFMDKRTPALQQLVQTWPFPVLSFQKLLRKCQHCERALIREKPNKLCVQAIILGVVTYLMKMLEDRTCSKSKGQRLKILDMTGLQDEGHGPESMSLWSRTVTLAKASLDISKQQSKCLKRSSKRRKGPYSSSVALPAPQPVSVDVWVDLFVNSTSYVVLKDALQINSGNALRLRCRDFRAEELSIASTVGLLEFLDPAGVRQVDLRFNNLGLSGLRVVLPHLTKFTNLASLKLPYSNIDVRRLTVGMEGSLQYFATQLSRLTCLKELNLGSSRLSGKLRQLLGDLRSPLESLELAFCYLLPNDFAYLSQSLHTSALKKLDLSGNNLSDNLLQPLQGLLTEAASTLLHLDIMECRLMDSHLNLLLPALCRCTSLRYLGVFGNPISAKGVKNLLHKTVGLLDLRLVIYPYPVDCYGDDLPWPPTSSNLLNGSVDEEKFSRVSNELQQMLLSANRGDAIWTTNLCRHNSLDYFSL
ncbi:leucine-rich repeat-containing protein 14 [Ahaetulla prasina]|uniref:leucine-rich repeat-containing protein 14 n=1 Tax=Ahaetulla prasina TaxID=499056 RepID=UPI00264750BE|nr:leucine-rich repeat-containing protein 14 [Ahaetulla prasina]XP_058032511.1 leucine-rich repeat-containing protein 14 [Ahaetulla prasina]XP_058032512.1 leucine-rich repeat-containing protein 14 [Ahaetulla prasina]XP_058032513.1 leucine-rich repeat-containing protein 14 [Ahaetulla prasina]XP_058032514.1 leucine-rich repeat-containing protein 14 [Ahaetulla prasina]XP_058032515.1 leucine-rich repeat-containing protein 14 [Ahaetulla prasina]XP_058032516.1 leucine-rich repeat-containing protein